MTLHNLHNQPPTPRKRPPPDTPIYHQCEKCPFSSKHKWQLDNHVDQIHALKKSIVNVVNLDDEIYGSRGIGSANDKYDKTHKIKKIKVGGDTSTNQPERRRESNEKRFSVLESDIPREFVNLIDDWGEICPTPRRSETVHPTTRHRRRESIAERQSGGKDVYKVSDGEGPSGGRVVYEVSDGEEVLFQETVYQERVSPKSKGGNGGMNVIESATASTSVTASVSASASGSVTASVSVNNAKEKNGTVFEISSDEEVTEDEFVEMDNKVLQNIDVVRNVIDKREKVDELEEVEEVVNFVESGNVSATAERNASPKKATTEMLETGDMVHDEVEKEVGFGESSNGGFNKVSATAERKTSPKKATSELVETFGKVLDEPEEAEGGVGFLESGNGSATADREVSPKKATSELVETGDMAHDEVDPVEQEGGFVESCNAGFNKVSATAERKASPNKATPEMLENADINNDESDELDELEGEVGSVESSNLSATAKRKASTTKATTSTPKTSRKCRICTKQFDTTPLFKTHLEEVHHIKDTTCLLCPKTCPTEQEVIRHCASIHENPDNSKRHFVCTSCHATFKQQRKLHRHLGESKHVGGTYRGRPLFESLFDGESVKITIVFENEDSHPIEKRKKCRICSTELDSQEEFTTHLREKHRIDESRCLLCDKDYGIDVVRHCILVHENPDQSKRYYACGTCKGTFCQLKRLVRHLDETGHIGWVYKGREMSESELRGKDKGKQRLDSGRVEELEIFNDEFDDQYDRDIYNTLEDYERKCRVCLEIVDTDRINFDNHLYEAHSIEDDKCLHCNKQFETYLEAAQHCRLIHENPDRSNRHYACNGYCGGTFSDKESLIRHLNETGHSYATFHGIPMDDSELIAKTNVNDSMEGGSGVASEKQGRTCLVCQKQFDGVKDLKLHQDESHHLKGRFCLRCDKKFKLRHDALRHCLAIHENPDQSNRCYSCSTCNATFVTKRNIRRHFHETNHTGALYLANPMSESELRQPDKGKEVLDSTSVQNCGVCSKSFDTSNSFISHLENDHHIVGNTCQLCNKEYVSRQEVQRHCATIHENPDTSKRHFVCTSCHATFKQQRKLHRHLEESKHVGGTKRGRPLFESHIDGESVKITLVEKEEVPKEVSKPIEKRKKCRICSTELDSQEEFKMHLREKHKIDESRCLLCDKDYGSGQYVVRHCMLVHENPNQSKRHHSCNTCAATFGNIVRLRVHLRQTNHTGGMYRGKPLSEIELSGKVRVSAYQDSDSDDDSLTSIDDGFDQDSVVSLDSDSSVEQCVKYGNDDETTSSDKLNEVSPKIIPKSGPVELLDGLYHHCSFCNRNYLSGWILAVHLKGVHKLNETMIYDYFSANMENVYFCFECSLVYRNQHSLDRHMQQKHSSRSDADYGVKMDVEFEDDEILRNGSPSIAAKAEEMDVDQSPKNYVCNVCLMEFKKKSNMIKHQASHGSKTTVLDNSERRTKRNSRSSRTLAKEEPLFGSPAKMSTGEKSPLFEIISDLEESSKPGPSFDLLFQDSDIEKTKRHSCHICTQDFLRPNSLVFHLGHAHGLTIAELGEEFEKRDLKGYVLCAQCGVCTASENSFVRHCRAVHERSIGVEANRKMLHNIENVEPFTESTTKSCKSCSKFIQMTKLARHLVRDHQQTINAAHYEVRKLYPAAVICGKCFITFNNVKDRDEHGCSIKVALADDTDSDSDIVIPGARRRHVMPDDTESKFSEVDVEQKHGHRYVFAQDMLEIDVAENEMGKSLWKIDYIPQTTGNPTQTIPEPIADDIVVDDTLVRWEDSSSIVNGESSTPNETNEVSPNHSPRPEHQVSEYIKSLMEKPFLSQDSDFYTVNTTIGYAKFPRKRPRFDRGGV